eukprot:2917613-Pyramimonas_sp.AAC.1
MGRVAFVVSSEQDEDLLVELACQEEDNDCDYDEDDLLEGPKRVYGDVLGGAAECRRGARQRTGPIRSE